MAQLPVKEGFTPIPAGRYRARITDVTVRESGVGEQARTSLCWAIEVKGFTEQPASWAWTSTIISAGSKAGAWIVASGLKLPSPGETFDTDLLVDRVVSADFIVETKVNPDGTTKEVNKVTGLYPESLTREQEPVQQAPSNATDPAPPNGSGEAWAPSGPQPVGGDDSADLPY